MFHQADKFVCLLPFEDGDLMASFAFYFHFAVDKQPLEKELFAMPASVFAVEIHCFNYNRGFFCRKCLGYALEDIWIKKPRRLGEWLEREFLRAAPFFAHMRNPPRDIPDGLGGFLELRFLGKGEVKIIRFHARSGNYGQERTQLLFEEIEFIRPL